jgi:hypothetical protein
MHSASFRRGLIGFAVLIQLAHCTCTSDFRPVGPHTSSGLRVDYGPLSVLQRCRALYHVVEVAGGPKIVTPRRRIVERKERCRLCGEPLPSGPSALRYFLLPTTAVTKVKHR